MERLLGKQAPCSKPRPADRVGATVRRAHPVHLPQCQESGVGGERHRRHRARRRPVASLAKQQQQDVHGADRPTRPSVSRCRSGTATSVRPTSNGISP